jgi:flavin reductase (DIM6/NTAB) family NADH-FMN oxidoreductase RutF
MATQVGVDPATELQAAFRAAMGSVAAPVSVVTTYAGGRPHGATVSAFASLSMEPPMLLVSLQTGSRLLALLTPGTPVGVNVLAADQHRLADAFARPAEDRFAGVDWSLVDGSPALADAHAWVGLTVARLVPAGDHVVVLGDVLGAAARTAGDPLTYHRRRYGTHLPH